MPLFYEKLSLCLDKVKCLELSSVIAGNPNNNFIELDLQATQQAILIKNVVCKDSDYSCIHILFQTSNLDCIALSNLKSQLGAI